MRAAILSLVLALLPGLSACERGDGVEPPPEHVEEPAATEPAAPRPKPARRGPFKEVAFTCCGTDQGVQIVAAFSDLGARLAADDAEGSSAGVGPLVAAISDTSKSAPPGLAAVKAAASGLSEASDIDGIRAAYLELSLPMIELARGDAGGEDTFVVAYCPMKPGRWIQAGETLANPYYGAEMLRCGTFEELVRPSEP